MTKKTKPPRASAPALPKGFTKGSAPNSFRWVPEPYRLRPDGWKSITFKHPDGRYLSMGEAIDACAAINRLVDDWYDHGLAPAGQWASVAPLGAKPRVITTQKPDAIGRLIDDWQASHSFNFKKNHTPKAEGTKRFYKDCILRLVETVAGHPYPPHRQDLPAEIREAEIARYNQDMAETRAYSVKVLLKKAEDKVGPIQQAYYDLLDAGREIGSPMITLAKNVVVTAHVFFEWCILEGHLEVNPAARVRCQEPQGRVAIWEDDERQAMLAAALATGWKSIHFAARLSQELSWGRGDILALTLGQFREDVKYIKGQPPKRVVRVEGARLKTGNRTFTTLTQAGIELYDELLAWHRERLGKGIELLGTMPAIVVDDFGPYRPGAGGRWTENYFTYRFRQVRAAASDTLGRPILKYFSDLRDSAITEMNEAGLTRHHKQSRNQHTLESIDKLDQKHYGMTTLAISDEAAELLDTLRARKREHESEVNPKTSHN
ncbi:hypothetical protein [Asticcacaulis taihuensis]|uniref:hypothetical protein n=1 Tax=Asticcacaulis taihuensis TaxID=260084 RepID=UPI0026F0C4A0|nr:hypothetical protein [Asticcacaulis taihuensis]